jgi:peptide/nickel transport system ATP-binding protein
MTAELLVDVQDLHVTFNLPNRTVYAVNGASFSVREGRALGIVGESGSGKSVAAQSIPRLVSSSGLRVSGRINLRHAGSDVDTLALPANGRQMREIRSGTVSVIFQEPMRSLHPMFTVGWQIAEGLRVGKRMTGKQARERAVDLLRLVGLPDPVRNAGRFPHQLSGGMRQRVMIAIALAASPRLLIADEPTTALDVTIQAQILELLGGLRRELGMAVILITHDLGVIAEAVDDVAVMYLGQVVESGPVAAVMRAPLHPYTRGLISTTPRLDSVPKSDLATLKGNIPELAAPPQACVFADRCQNARAICKRPPPVEKVGDSVVRCWIYSNEWVQA